MATEHAEETADLDIPMIVTIGAVSVAITVALILAVQALYYRSARVEHELKVIAAGASTSDSRIAEQKAQLTRYGWLDRQQGKVTIPIDQAMRLVVRELQVEQDEPKPDSVP